MGAGGSAARRGLVAECRVPPVVVVVVFPVADDNAGLGHSDQKLLMFRHSSRTLELKDST